MIRVRKAVLGRGRLLRVVAVWAPPASAVTALTVTPNTDLVSGQILTVEGSGFTPNSSVGFCQAVDDGSPSSSDCSGRIQTTTASATGTISGELQVRRLDDHGRDCAVVACAIAAAETEDIVGTVAFAPISFDPDVPAPRPDARIKNRSTGEIYGNDVYPPAPMTRRRHTISEGGYWTFAVQVENDGGADSFRITANRGDQMTVRYFSGYYDITAAAAGAGATLRNVAPGKVRTIAVQVHNTFAVPGDFNAFNVRFTSVTDGTFDEAASSCKVAQPT